jgi:GNAT superfamily N-acetyltransferase
MHSLDDIMRASAAWVWFPRDSDHEKSELQLVRYPQRFGGGVRGSQVASDLDAAAVLDHAVERTRTWGESRLTFWTNASDSPDLEAELQHRGAEHTDTVAVFARSIDGISVEVPPNVTTEVVRTLEQVREVDAVNAPVWDQHPLDEIGLQEELAEVSAGLESGEGARVLARLDGVAVSTGGCTVIDGFVRLWGAATLPEARGRGAYRAVLAQRLRVGAGLGATTALVKGRISTSAPILARAGFTHYGDERAYVLNV